MYFKLWLVVLGCMFLSVGGYGLDDPQLRADFAVSCDLAGRSELERRQAIERIVSRGGEVEADFIALLASEQTIERQLAAEILGASGGAQSETALITALTHKDVFLQGAAARALAVLYSRLPQQYLLARLGSDPSNLVTLAVLYGAYKRARYKSEELDPDLVRRISALVLVSEDATVLEAAVTVLKFANTQEAVLALIQIAGHSENTEILCAVCQALAAIAPEGKSKEIERLAFSGRARLEVEAWIALTAMGYTDTDKALSGLAVNPDPQVQARAIEALSEFGGKYMPLFISALKSVDAGVRLQALYALKRIAAEPAAANIAEMMGPQGDIDPVIRAEAALVFAELTRSGGLVPLLKDARNSEPQRLEYRLEAIRALGKLGDAGALRALLDLLRDDNEAVRLQAVRALGALGDKRALPRLQEAAKHRNGQEELLLQEVITILGG